MSSSQSPFNWRNNPRPSIFADEPGFKPNKSGKTHSQVVTASVEKRTKATGRSPGSISGLSDKGDRHILHAQHQRRAAR